jgi:hypothetical protein
MTKKEEARLKKALLEEIRVFPNFRVACERLKIPIPIFYKWKREDEEYWDEVTRGLEIGKDWTNDLAIEQLHKLIEKGSLPAIKYWLEHNNPDYRKRKLAEPAPEEGKYRTLADIFLAMDRDERSNI